MTGTLRERIEKSAGADVHPSVAAYAAMLGEGSGAKAVLFYGSNLRTGLLEGVLDFYVLLPGEQQDRIWPRVSYREWEKDGVVLRAKIATMALATFARAARGESRDTTIWARFVQPAALVWAGDDSARADVIEALGQAAQTAGRLAAALGPREGTAEDFWRSLFQATYRAEFRVEKPGREDSILSVNQEHFDGLLPLAWEAQGIEFVQAEGKFAPQMEANKKQQIIKWWNIRRRLGKPLNLLRLAKASTTFEGAARYAAWKIHRHTGVELEVTPWREKHPLLAAPGVLFKLWKARRQSG